MTIHVEHRKQKPKRADFRWEGKRYWISACDYWSLWDGEYDEFVTFTVKDYETDEEYYGPENDDKKAMDFLDKVHHVGHRVLPVDPRHFPSTW